MLSLQYRRIGMIATFPATGSLHVQGREPAKQPLVWGEIREALSVLSRHRKDGGVSCSRWLDFQIGSPHSGTAPGPGSITAQVGSPVPEAVESSHCTGSEPDSIVA